MDRRVHGNCNGRVSTTVLIDLNTCRNILGFSERHDDLSIHSGFLFLMFSLLSLCLPDFANDDFANDANATGASKNLSG
jgi:hypothetical protein